jgi:hypothetical protein
LGEPGWAGLAGWAWLGRSGWADLAGPIWLGDTGLDDPGLDDLGLADPGLDDLGLGFVESAPVSASRRWSTADLVKKRDVRGAGHLGSCSSPPFIL